MTMFRVTLVLVGKLIHVAGASAGSCHADPDRIAAAMAVVVASYKCSGFEHALFGKPLDIFIGKSGIIDQSTGACERERALATSAATDQMLAGREAFCTEIAARLASDPILAQALAASGARYTP
ncbi:MAG: hypothetical protein R3D57_16975 [Hyphomicrobiaceae bacterium]